MTSQSSSTKCGSLALLLNTLKRRWTTGLLIAIIMFFSLPVPVLMYISSEINWYNRSGGAYYGDGSGEAIITLAEALSRDLLGWAEIIRAVMIPLVAVLAVVMSCIMLRYLHGKTSVDFYHSLPIRRERLLTVNLTAGYILLIVPYLAMLAVSGIIIAVNGAMTGEILLEMLVGVGEVITYSLVFYALSSLVGVVTGVTAVQLLLTAVAIFIIPALYAATVLFASIFNENLWMDYYFSGEILKRLSPVLEFIADECGKLEPRQYFTYLVTAALLFVATFAVYRRFRSERAGMTMIFPALGNVIKYTLMVLMTICGGLLFYAILESFIWTVFGMICGAVLTFMLTNTVINKSAKAMFLGLKGLGIYAVASALVMVVLLTNLFGINTGVPSSSGKIKASFGSITSLIEFKDDAAVEALTRLYTDSEWRGSNSYTESYLVEKDGYAVPKNQIQVNFVFYPRVGIPVAKSVHIVNLNAFEAEMRTILDSEDFASGYRELFIDDVLRDTLENTLWHYSGFNYRVSADGLVVGDGFKDETKFVDGLLPALERDLASVGYETFQSPVLAYTRLHTSEGVYDLNISTEMPATLELLRDSGMTNIAPDEIVDTFADSVRSFKVIRISDGKTAVFVSKDEKRELAKVLDSLTLNRYESCELTLREPDYVVVYEVETNSENDASTRAYDYSSGILLGRIPDFVAREFG